METCRQRLMERWWRWLEVQQAEEERQAPGPDEAAVAAGRHVAAMAVDVAAKAQSWAEALRHRRQLAALKRMVY